MTMGSEQSRFLAMLAFSAGIFCIQLDAFALNLALLAIAQDFAIPIERLKWVVSGYLLSVGIFMLAAGRLSDGFGHGRLLRLGLALFGAAALVLGGQAWARAADALSAPLPRQIYLPEVPGWQRVDYRPQVWWEPRATGADHRLLGRYADAAGNEVDVFVALYAAQSEGKEAGGFGEGALRPDSDWAWQGEGPQVGDAGTERLLAQGRVMRLAQTWYRSGDLLGGSNARLKLANIADRLLLRPRPTMLLILSAEARPGHDPARALAAFRLSTGDLAPWMDRLAQLR